MNNPNNKNFNNFTSNQTNNKESSTNKKNETNSNQKEKNTSENQNIFNPTSIKQQINNNYPSDIYAEDSDFEIDSSSKNITDTQRYNNITGRTNSLNKNTNNNNNDNSKSYIEQLEAKIQEQAKRLNELNKYKYLCEKRIRQLNPNEDLPITEDSLKIKNYNNNNNNNNNLISNNDRKYEQLYEKYNKLLKDFNELLKNNNNQRSSNNMNNSDNNNSNESISYEKYKKLKNKYIDIKNQNEKFIQLLREETLATEEQKNIIALLQQTIDNDLIKNGIINKYITSNNLIDFTKLKNESEQYRKELVLSQALVNSLKSEIEQ